MTKKENLLSKIIAEAIRKIKPKNPYVSGPSQGSNRIGRGMLSIGNCKTEVAHSSVTNTDKEYISVELTHVWSDRAQNLINAINTSVPKHVLIAALPKPEKPGTIVLKVNIEMKNEIPNVINKMRDAIKQLNDYNERNIDYVCDQIFNYVDGVVVTADKNGAREKSIANWRDMLQKLKDPAVREKLLNYQTTDDYANIYGHVLSADNKFLVLTQKPDASFVAEKHTWERVFNRRVMPGAQKILVKKPLTNNNADMLKKDEAARIAGFASYAEARRLTRNSTQVMHKIDLMASQDKRVPFKTVKMYDVSETIPPSDPKDDVWMNEIGLSNNINGVLNSEAVKFDDAKVGSAKAKKEADKAKISEITIARWKNRRQSIIDLCKWKHVDISSLLRLSDEEFIPNASYVYTKKIISPSYNIIESSNVDKVATMVAVCVCYVCDCPVPAKFANRVNTLNCTDNDAASAFTIMSDIIPAIDKSGRLTQDEVNSLQSQKFDVTKNKKYNESKKTFKDMLNEEKSNIIDFDDLMQMCQQKFGTIKQILNQEEGEEALEEEKNNIKGYISEMVKKEMSKYYHK